MTYEFAHQIRPTFLHHQLKHGLQCLREEGRDQKEREGPEGEGRGQKEEGEGPEGEEEWREIRGKERSQ